MARNIAITRPVGKGEDTAEYVKSLGWTPFIFHTVELKPLSEQKVKDQIESRLRGPVDWIVFMSSSGVDLHFETLMSNPIIRDSSHGTGLLAVGPKTREALIRHGAVHVAIPDRSSSAGVSEFFSRSDPTNLRIVLVRSSSADDYLAQMLESRGAFVTTINVYESALPHEMESTFIFLEGLSKGRFSAVLFTSAVSVSNFFSIAGVKVEESEVLNLLKRVRVGAIGPVTAEALRKRGLDPVVPDEYLLQTAVKKLIDLFDAASLMTAG